MLCLASQMMDSASSSVSMAGRLIFLMITALPEMDTATSREAILALSKTARMASATAAGAMIWRSTMASWGRGW